MADDQVTKAVRAAVRSARAGGLDAVDEARAALAVKLAKTLDAGAGLIEASVARELRVTLGELPVPTEEASAVDELARLRADRRAKAAAPKRAPKRDVGGTGGRRTRR